MSDFLTFRSFPNNVVPHVFQTLMFSHEHTVCMNSRYVKQADWIIGVKSLQCVIEFVQLCGQKVRLVMSSHLEDVSVKYFP
jgi:hypothetical protein